MTIFLDLDDLIAICTAELGSFPVRDIGLIESALARPRATAFGADAYAYADDWTKAAALLESLVVNHALVDGNKRLAWMATKTFLIVNGHEAATKDANASYEVVIGLARDGTNDIKTVALALQDVLGERS